MSDDEDHELTEAIVAFERNLWTRLVAQGLNEETLAFMKRAQRLYGTNESILRHHRELERVTGVRGIVSLVEQFLHETFERSYKNGRDIFKRRT